MNNQIFKFAGLNSAILATLMLVVSPFEYSAQPPLVPDGGFTKERILECPASDAIAPAALASANDFWQQAWGRELTVGHEGMVLQETNASGVWEILVTSKSSDRYTDRGTFVEETRHPLDLGAGNLDQAYKQAAKATGIQRYVIAGTVTGSTGTAVAVTAMVTHLSSEKGSIARIFSILEIATDSSAAAAFAEHAVSQLDISARNDNLTSEEPGIEKSSPTACRQACGATRATEKQLCTITSTACIALAGATATGCFIGCNAVTGGIAFLACLAVCDAILAAGLTLCTAQNVSCRNAADAKYITCRNACEGGSCAINCSGGSPDH